MLTKRDIELLKEVFVTKQEFQYGFNELINLIVELKNDNIKIFGEIKDLREEVTVVVGYRDMIEEHGIRLTKLESQPRSKN